jgi:hypothetical protein
VRGDYDGDGRTDIAVFRPTTGQWFILGSRAGLEVRQFGQGGTLAPITAWLTSNPLAPGSTLTQHTAAIAQDANASATSAGNAPDSAAHPQGPLALAKASAKTKEKPKGRPRSPVVILGHWRWSLRLARKPGWRITD